MLSDKVKELITKRKKKTTSRKDLQVPRPGYQIITYLEGQYTGDTCGDWSTRYNAKNLRVIGLDFVGIKTQISDMQKSAVLGTARITHKVLGGVLMTQLQDHFR